MVCLISSRRRHTRGLSDWSSDVCSSDLSEKLARLLVGWLDQNTASKNPSQVKLALTHEEIGQMIGSSRETVSRLFAGFKKQHLITQSGSTLVIPNRVA